MTIGELAEKTGLDRRRIDYLTNLGIIPTLDKELIVENSANQSDGYRQYGPEAVRKCELALIALAMNGRPIEKYIQILELLPKSDWDYFVVKRIEENIEEITRCHKMALDIIARDKG